MPGRTRHVEVVAGSDHRDREEELRINVAPPTTSIVRAERRRNRTRGLDSPHSLVLANAVTSRQQLHDARENLKAGRRRVVQLEDAVANWDDLAAQLKPVQTSSRFDHSSVA